MQFFSKTIYNDGMTGKKSEGLFCGCFCAGKLSQKGNKLLRAAVKPGENKSARFCVYVLFLAQPRRRAGPPPVGGHIFPFNAPLHEFFNAIL
jgi:hypothetical protein